MTTVMTLSPSPLNEPHRRQSLSAASVSAAGPSYHTQPPHLGRSGSPAPSTRATTPAARTTSPEHPEAVNPYHAFASGTLPPPEVHIVKVAGDTVQISPGPQKDSLLGKVGLTLGRLPGFGSAADLPISPAGPPPPSPPESVEDLRMLPVVDGPEKAEAGGRRVDSPEGGAQRRPQQQSMLAPSISRVDTGEGPSTPRLTFEEPQRAYSNSPESLHPPRYLSASAPSAPSPLMRSSTDSRTTFSGSANSPNAASSRLRSSTFDEGSESPPTTADSAHGKLPEHAYLQPPHPHSPAHMRPTRRNTTGSALPSAGKAAAKHSPMLGGTGAGALMEEPGDGALASDIELQAEQIRRERERRRAKAQQEAEAALTREKSSAATIRPQGEDNSPLVGNLIGEDHVNYVMMYNMLTGIRIAVSRCQAKIKRPLTDEDFTARHKYSFDIVGNELTPSAKYDFKFKDYAPFVFRELREDDFHLDPSDYLMSLTAKYILSELGSPGKSGSFFYFSRDYRFIIKTVHHTEHKFLRSIIKDYYRHVKENPHTLISRFYGLHRVKLPRGRKIHFVIMNNLFPPHKDIHETYDLKGSTVGREYPEEKARTNPRAVLKDLNWINRGKCLELGPEKRALLTEQLRRDSELLKRLHVMDYSLLVGAHNVKRGNRDNVRSNTLKVFSPDMPRVRRTPTLGKGPKSPEAAALRRAMRESDPRRLCEGVSLPEEDTGDRQHFVFYQDDGGMRATDEGNEPLQTIYYLGVIDILTPYNTLKKLEHIWKGLKNDRHKISPVPPAEYGDRFFSFMKAIMRGGGGGAAFVAKKNTPAAEAHDGAAAPPDGGGDTPPAPT